MVRANVGDCVPEDVDFQLFIRCASTTAAFTVLIWEYLLTWKSELVYIWRPPFNIGQLIFVCARYSGLGFQSYNLFLVFAASMTPLPVQDASTCVRHVLPSLIAARMLLNMLDAILMLELYALYHKHKFVAAILILLFVGLLTSEIIVGYYNLGRTRYNCICDITKTHSSVLFFAVTIWIVHLNLGVLLVATRRLVKSNRPMVNLVNRDGMCVIILVCAGYAVIVPYSLITGPTKSHIMFGWPITLLSIACCRLIINMQKLYHDQALLQWETQDCTPSESQPPLSDVISVDEEDNDPDVETNSSPTNLRSHSDNRVAPTVAFRI